jgi:quercetin dioxygenase-like cupin family protein
MQYVRIYTGSDGETHFEDLEVELAEVDFAPPAPPVQLSAFTAATKWAFLSLPAGWEGDWHREPGRSVLFYLAGQSEIEVSDGAIRHFGPGDVSVVEDTTGKGHRSKTVGDETALKASVQMPDDE